MKEHSDSNSKFTEDDIISFRLRPPTSFLSHISYDIPGLVLAMNVLFR